MTKERRTYKPRIVGDKVMMPADLKRLHKYMLDVEHIGVISNEMREVVEELWLELAHKLPPKRLQAPQREHRQSEREREHPDGEVDHRNSPSAKLEDAATPAANSWRTPSWGTRVSRRNRALACGPHDDRRPACTFMIRPTTAPSARTS
jgi:hypothetical protein